MISYASGEPPNGLGAAIATVTAPVRTAVVFGGGRHADRPQPSPSPKFPPGL